MRRVRHRAAPVVMFLALGLAVACSDPVTVSPTRVEGDAVPWFAGGVEEAFEQAARLGKPLFLYWGAVWCPPCHNLKNEIFARPEFAERIRDFIPVYLDGDTERAQIWGERFDVSSYPTVVLFSPSGVEVFRMPSDVTVDRYAELLDAAIARFRPVHELLAEVLRVGPGQADRQDLELVAFHSWSQDRGLSMASRGTLEGFLTLYLQTPAVYEMARSRFLTLALESAMAASTGHPEGCQDRSSRDRPVPDEEQRREMLSGLLGVLSRADLWVVNKHFLTLRSADTVDFLTPAPGPARAGLVEAWLTAARGMEEHPQFSTTERLYALLPRLELARIDGPRDGPLPPELVEHVRGRADWVRAHVTDEGELQTVLNMAAWLLSLSGLDAEAVELLTEMMVAAEAPNYFMSTLGAMSGNDPERALYWHRMAYDRASHGSTRFRWGASFLQSMIELTPDAEDAILEASEEILGELLTLDDAFSGRNYAYLGDLEGRYRAWANDAPTRQQILARIRELVHARCEGYEDGGPDSPRRRCLCFLAATTGAGS